MGQSRWLIIVVVISLSFVLPTALCLWLALVEFRSFLDLTVASLSAGVWTILLLLVNWWEFTSIWLRWTWAAALFALIAYRVLAAPSLPLGSPLTPVTAANAVLAAFGTWFLAGAVAARRPEGEAVELSFPLSVGRFLITDGGDGARSFLINYHYGFGQHRAAGVNRSMRYAMDVVEVGRAGGESHGFLPRRNSAYRIWERSLHAPCDGRVVHTVNDVADNPAFGSDRPYGVGNHVVIRRGDGVYVVLGHLRQGSVALSPGAEVRAGEEIGRVGNSGWTERPHLHMQAMRSADGDWWHGEPLAIRFAGRFLVRNQLLRV